MGVDGDDGELCGVVASFLCYCLVVEVDVLNYFVLGEVGDDCDGVGCVCCGFCWDVVVGVAEYAGEARDEGAVLEFGVGDDGGGVRCDGKFIGVYDH